MNKADLWKLSLDVYKYQNSNKTDADFYKIYPRVNYLQERYYNKYVLKYDHDFKVMCDLTDYLITSEVMLDALKYYNINKLNKLNQHTFFSSYLKVCIENFIKKTVKNTVFVTRVDYFNEEYTSKLDELQAKKYKAEHHFTLSDLDTHAEINDKYLFKPIEEYVSELLDEYCFEQNTNIRIQKELNVAPRTFYRILNRIEEKMKPKLKYKNDKYQL